MELNNIQGEKMELYHKITKEVLELLLKEGAQMPVDLGRKLQRSSSNDPKWAPWEQHRLHEFKEMGIDKRKCDEKKKIKDYWKD